MYSSLIYNTDYHNLYLQINNIVIQYGSNRAQYRKESTRDNRWPK